MNSCNLVINPLCTLITPQVANFINNATAGNANNANTANNANNVNNANAGGIILTIILIFIIQILPVVLIAVNCNPGSPATYGILAFLFPGLYLFQHAIRKYALSEKGYCGNK